MLTLPAGLSAHCHDIQSILTHIRLSNTYLQTYISTDRKTEDGCTQTVVLTNYTPIVLHRDPPR